MAHEDSKLGSKLARTIENAILAVLDEGYRTQDMVQRNHSKTPAEFILGTREFARNVTDKI